jgi:hypothetical protein
MPFKIDIKLKQEFLLQPFVEAFNFHHWYRSLSSFLRFFVSSFLSLCQLTSCPIGIICTLFPEKGL